MSASEQTELENTIEALEAQRRLLGDAVVEASITALRKQLADLEPPSQQRKMVTVLFMDIVSSTNMVRDLDPEDNMLLMDTALEQLAAPVKEHGGHITRYMGDGFKAVFGSPIARENDPEMAIRAGLGILSAAREYAGKVEAGWGIPNFTVRIGINTGMAVIGGYSEAEDTIMGTVVNLAARLESAAEPGTLLISHDSYELVRGLFDFEPLPPIQAKGFPEPVRVFQVLRAKARPLYRSMRGIKGVETRMVGRDMEFQQLQNAFEQMINRDQRLMITVMGEAGLGKSRLLYEFENWIDLMPVQARIYKGQARPETQNMPFGLLRDIFVFCFDIQDDDRAAVVREKIERGIGQALKMDKKAQMKAHFIGHLLGFGFHTSPHLENVLEDAQQIRDRTLIYLRDYFKAVVAQIPVVVLVEDIHWADDSSLDALNQLVMSLPDHPYLILAGTRPTLLERRPHWGQKQPFHRQLNLRLLSEQDSYRLLDQVLHKLEDSPRALGELLIGKAEGNPYYMEELVKMLIEEEVIVTGKEQWRLEHERLMQLQVPPTLTGVLQARLDRLPIEERMVLQQAAVVGRVFWDVILQRINQAEQISVDLNIDRALVALRDRELIFRHETSLIAGAVEHIFKHALMLEVVYESVLKRMRPLYHARVADWLIENASDRENEFLGLIGDHLEIAGDHPRACDSLWLAGQAAAKQFANEEAIAYFDRALALALDENLERRYQLILDRAKIYDLLGKRDLQKEDLVTLENLSNQLGEFNKQTQVALQQAIFAENTSDYRSATTVASKAVNLAQETGNREHEVEGYLTWGTALMRQGAHDEARVCLEHALERSEHYGLRLLVGPALRSLGNVAHAQGDYQEAQEYYQQSLIACRAIGDQRGESASLGNLGIVAYLQEDYLAAREYAEQALEIFQAVGDRRGESEALNNLGVFAGAHGDYPAARDFYEGALTIARQIGNRIGEGRGLINLGDIASAQGDYQSAYRYIDQALTIRREIGDRVGEAYALTQLGESLIELECWAQAQVAFQRAVDLRETLGQVNMAMESRAGLARLALHQGILNRAKKQVNIILEYLETDGSLDGIDWPFRIYLTCYQVLKAGHDPRARDILSQAYTLLLEHAANIPDQDSRRAFLENVPWHLEIVRLWDNLENK
jgi:predicted ATPase/class 3 adenylate cyclase